MLRLLCRDYEKVEAADLLLFLEGLRQEYLAARTTRRQLMAAGRRLSMALKAVDGVDGKPITVFRDDALKLIDQIETFQQALDAQLKSVSGLTWTG